jgi:hypothetical protein
MKLLARCALAGALTITVTALAMDAAYAAKKRTARIPPDACKVAGGYIPTGQACTGAPNQFNVGQMHWCSFGNLTPGIYCAGPLCPATRC